VCLYYRLVIGGKFSEFLDSSFSSWDWVIVDVFVKCSVSKLLQKCHEPSPWSEWNCDYSEASVC